MSSYSRHVAASVVFFFALSPPAIGLAFADELEQLKRENVQMKEMLMQMQEQLQSVIAKTNAMESQVEANKEDITIKTTGGGIQVKSSNGDTFKVGGRLMLDHDSYDSFWNGGDGSAEENEIRRSRITFSGNSGKNWAYKLTVDIDHEDENASIDTGWLQYSEGGVGVKVGKFGRPGMIEERTSSKWISTIERSIINELAGATISKPNFGGVALSYKTEGDLPMSAEFGVYDDEIDEDDGSDIYGIGYRLAISPEFGDNSFAHLGASGYSVDYKGQDLRMRSRMGVHTAGRPFETRKMATDDITQVGVELAYVRGPFSLQAEYMNVESDGTDNGACVPPEVAIKRNDGGSAVRDDDGKVQLDSSASNTCDMEMDGFYLQAAYTLTGETRGYKAGSGAFAAIKPKSASGAWELVARYEDAEVDVDAQGLNSELNRMVLGLNWYANKNLKFMLNYVDSEIDGCYGNMWMVDRDVSFESVPSDNVDHASGDGMFVHKACGNGMDKDDGNAISLRAQYVF